MQPFHHQSTQVWLHPTAALSRLRGTANLILKREPYINSLLVGYCVGDAGHLGLKDPDKQALPRTLQVDPVRGEKLASDWVEAHTSSLE